MISIFLIILCWLVEMPLWLSIVGTVICSLDLLSDIVSG